MPALEAKAVPSLFAPIKIGNLPLSHRVVFAPVTRVRATDHVPSPLAVEYYRQRASQPGTLLVTEAALINAGMSDFPGISGFPGIWSDEQVDEWKKVADTVHAKGSFAFLQIAILPPAPNPANSTDENILPVSLMKEYANLFGQAAYNAVHRAGFDGVEIHSCNGYFMDQFLKDGSNLRTDEYGVTVEGRSKFPLEVVEAVSKVVGQERTAIRLSPWGSAQGAPWKDPLPTYTYFVTQLRKLYPDLAYLHLVEPRIDRDVDRVDPIPEGASNDFIRKIWTPKPLISAGGYTREMALETAETKGDLIAFGRYFIANPDLPYRFIENIPLNKYNRATFYAPGTTAAEGYTDYPFAQRNDRSS